jgi:uncharacterized protein (TIGR04255 family)
MPESFKNAPLVELVAELRWGPQVAPMPGGANPVLAVVPGQHEDFFNRFSSSVAALGYERAERILPPGFPAVPGQATLRYRKRAPEDGTSLYQIGNGVFTANITPPYHSWREFRPVVELGVDSLLNNRNESERQSNFAPVLLRYLDAFSPRFTEGRSAAKFVEEVLGFSINLPEPLRVEMAPGAEAKATLQLSLPLQNSRQMNLTLTEGTVFGEHAIIMDIAVITETPIDPDMASVMAAFDVSHEVIHRMFVGLTQKLFHIMEPETGGKK